MFLIEEELMLLILSVSECCQRMGTASVISIEIRMASDYCKARKNIS